MHKIKSSKYMIVLLSALSLIILASYVYDYHELRNHIEGSANLSYHNIILTMIAYHQELDHYIHSHDSTNDTNLYILENNIKNIFSTYGVTINLIDGTDKKLYLEQHSLFKLFLQLLPLNYTECSLQELRYLSEQTSIIIGELQRLRQDTP
ncbi:hypothetical protein [Paenibacillus xylanexedens]|uniref:hypothetical protein n=1 Tax=Paenibacillus xylanexedens TaxID=528191 RepID=UPI0011A724FB|nr:hypothetical protein [Paenibacillus xylanexedens]